MKNLITLSFCIFSLFLFFATHNYAGEILVEQTGALTIKATVITYTTFASTPADRPSLVINWGDGTKEDAPRINGSGQLFQDTKFKKNIYELTHTFSQTGKYTIYMTDPNRNGGMLNVNFPLSDAVAFHIQTTITLMTGQKLNKTPELKNAPITVGTVGEVYQHNPQAVDADGDSLAYRLISPLQGLFQKVPLYDVPDNILPSANNKVTFDEKNGTFTWKSPQRAGQYTIAIQIISFRAGVAIDSTIRDMVIQVQGATSIWTENSGQHLVKVFPNPINTEGVLEVAEGFGNNINLAIYNSKGQLVKSGNFSNRKIYPVKKDDLPSGLYFINLTSEKHKAMLKIMVE